MFKLINGVLQDFFREIIKNEIEYYHLSFFSVFLLKKDQRGAIIWIIASPDHDFHYLGFHFFLFRRHKLSRISDFSFDFFNLRDQGKNRIRFVLEKQSTHDLSYWLNKNARKRPYIRRVKIEEN